MIIQKKNSKYWWFQIGGWLFFTMLVLFFAFTFEKEIKLLFIKRVLLAAALGFLFTHFLRILIKELKLLPPPLINKQWIQLVLLILLICVSYSLTNSSFVEWLGWYDVKMKVSVQKRFLYNLFNDSPIVLVWVSFYYLWHYVDASRNSQLDKVRLESLVKELELKTIKSHINPHFIFNALNSIRALVDENPNRARTAITQLSNLLRSSMHADSTETTTLEQELTIVKNYLGLELIRFEDRLKIEYQIDEDTLDQLVPPMMLQTLVENAIKHGISKLTDGGIVKIVSDFVDTHHELSVINTGKMNGDYNKYGFGVASTENRLALLFGKEASFTLRDTDENTVEAKVILPINS